MYNVQFINKRIKLFLTFCTVLPILPSFQFDSSHPQTNQTQSSHDQKCMLHLQHPPHESNHNFYNIKTYFPIERYTNAERARYTFMILSLSNLFISKRQYLRLARAQWCVQIHSLEDIGNFTTARFIVIIFRDNTPKITTQTNVTSYPIEDSTQIECIKNKI